MEALQSRLVFIPHEIESSADRSYHRSLAMLLPQNVVLHGGDMAKRRSSTEDKGKDTVGAGTKAKPAIKSGGPQSSPAIPEAASFSNVEFYARVARRAYDLFERRGREEGHDVEDWLEAERLVKDELLQDGESTRS